ncbi:MAG: acyl-CoA-binding protein [Bacteroidota bacterium]
MNLKKLTETELDNVFYDTYLKVSNTQKRFPQDILLHFYAYYKHAHKKHRLQVRHQPAKGEELINAFKANALFQIKQLSEKEAKIKYILLARKYLDE